MIPRRQDIRYFNFLFLLLLLIRTTQTSSSSQQQQHKSISSNGRLGSHACRQSMSRTGHRQSDTTMTCARSCGCDNLPDDDQPARNPHNRQGNDDYNDNLRSGSGLESQINTVTQGSITDWINALMNGAGIPATEPPGTTAQPSMYATLPDHEEYEKEQKRQEAIDRSKPKPKVTVQMKAGRDGPIGQVFVKEHPDEQDKLMTEFPIQLENQQNGYDPKQEWNRVLRRKGPQVLSVDGDVDDRPVTTHRPSHHRDRKIRTKRQDEVAEPDRTSVRHDMLEARWNGQGNVTPDDDVDDDFYLRGRLDNGQDKRREPEVAGRTLENDEIHESTSVDQQQKEVEDILDSNIESLLRLRQEFRRHPSVNKPAITDTKSWAKKRRRLSGRLLSNGSMVPVQSTVLSWETEGHRPLQDGQEVAIIHRPTRLDAQPKWKSWYDWVIGKTSDNPDFGYELWLSKMDSSIHDEMRKTRRTGSSRKNGSGVKSSSSQESSSSRETQDEDKQVGKLKASSSHPDGQIVSGSRMKANNRLSETTNGWRIGHVKRHHHRDDFDDDDDEDFGNFYLDHTGSDHTGSGEKVREKRETYSPNGKSVKDAFDRRRSCYMKCSHRRDYLEACTDACRVMKCTSRGRPCDMSCRDGCQADRALREMKAGSRILTPIQCRLVSEKVFFLYPDKYRTLIEKEIDCDAQKDM